MPDASDAFERIQQDRRRALDALWDRWVDNMVGPLAPGTVSEVRDEPPVRFNFEQVTIESPMEPRQPERATREPIMIYGLEINGQTFRIPPTLVRAGESIRVLVQPENGYAASIEVKIARSPQLTVERILETRRALDLAEAQQRLDTVEGGGQPQSLDGLQYETVQRLLDLAKEGNKEDFCFLAGSAGVRPENHETLWDGTRQRLRLETPDQEATP